MTWASSARIAPDLLRRRQQVLERVVEQPPRLVVPVLGRVGPVAGRITRAGLGCDHERPERRGELEAAPQVVDVRRADGAVGADEIPVARQRRDPDAVVLEVSASHRGRVGVFEALVEESGAELNCLQPEPVEVGREPLPLARLVVVRERAEARPRAVGVDAQRRSG